jgi:prolyl oligopeptidase
MRMLERMLVVMALLGPTLSEAQPLDYPATRRGDVVETKFGESIADPYRWLEGDVRRDAEVADWVARQNALTQQNLQHLPARAWFAREIAQLLNFERFGLPKKAGQRYFYTRNSGLQNQSQLFVRQGLHGQAQLLLDPNTWAKDGATALDDWEPSPSGRLLAYSVQDGGSDWRKIYVLDCATGQRLGDDIAWANDTNIAWAGDEGFFYSRFPQPAQGEEYRAPTFNKSVWYHRIGTAQSADLLVFATPDHPDYSHKAKVTSDGRYLVITSEIGTDARYEIHMIDLTASPQAWHARALVTGFTDDWKLVDHAAGRLYFVTNAQAPMYRVVATGINAPGQVWREVVPQGKDKIEDAHMIGGRLIVSRLHDASTQVTIHDLDGHERRQVKLGGRGTAFGFHGSAADTESFFGFTSFNQPTTIYRLDAHSGKSEVFAQPKLGFDPQEFVVEQHFYPSKDGTRIPLFLLRTKAQIGRAAPTLLYGYGGFDISLTPGFSAARMAWVRAGGVFAMANLRGGGEYGRAWHDGGRLGNKQNVFDDFIAAGDYLIAQGITTKGGLAVQGGSNGGLLVGAVVNQRPDLFAAANPAVGVMDMLRFDQFTAGRYWVDDYGHPDREGDFKTLRAYSPYHNIAASVAYPAILVTTADTDDRVVPGHSFKYAAALQYAPLGPKPRLIRIETRAGHGSGKPTDKVVAEGADVLGFLAQWTGLVPTGSQKPAP